MKVFIADRLAMFVDPVFAAPGIYNGLTIWLAALSYTMQIYCDFAGYSAMAIGTAHVLGYDFKENFNLPYISKSIDEFWRRWHISLSSWLRDYLYISLGGNRNGRYRTYCNLIITMLLGGLWHGAAWTFVMWGALRGLQKDPSAALAGSGWLITMMVVICGWVLFRSTTFGDAALMLKKMAFLYLGVSWYCPFPIAVILGFGVVHALHAFGYGHVLELPETKWYTPAVLLSMIGLVMVFFPTGFHPFIYFQF